MSKWLARLSSTKVLPNPNDEKSNGLWRTLNWFDLIAFGVGNIVGAGIFVLTGEAARKYSGPSITLAFLLDGIACIFSALCYSEFASRVPVAGSSYTYAYVTCGELVAFLIGWAIILAYGLAIAVVGRGWSSYLVALFDTVKVKVPSWIYAIPASYQPYIDNFDPLSAVVILIITVYLLFGIKQSTWLNNVVTAISLFVVLFVIALGAFYIDPLNWIPFTPYGINGIFNGASVVFFAYIGFDCVANCSEECKNPHRDLPLGIVGSLVIVTALYCSVALVVTGMESYLEIDTGAPLAKAFDKQGLGWASIIISVGALAGLTTTILTSHVALSRIIFSIARDGLLPRLFANLHPENNTPTQATILVGILTALLAFFFDIDALAELVSAGTLVSFLFVCLAIPILRMGECLENIHFKNNSTNEKPFKLLFYSLLGAFCIACTAAGVVQVNQDRIEYGSWILLAICWDIVVPLGVMIICYFWYLNNISNVQTNWYGALQKQTRTYVIDGQAIVEELNERMPFRCPFVPLIPLLGVAVNIWMICNLSTDTFIGFSAWIFIGMLCYFLYGMSHSELRNQNRANDESHSFLTG